MAVTMRDTSAVQIHFVMAVSLGLLHTSTFYQLDDVNLQVVMVIAFVTINPSHIALISAGMVMRDVLFK
ncbi:hypothetical protein GN958_ATG21945 [Phytophthora infestans]|uniref:Transmembrane protein n=1 Tax=Phytophthora infestans TaxID=4787 RepID=A0A8S9TQQ3_PHYIN|nr:hypothetical protein GN958_ATG21945 [Phytophthora infestans]